MPWDATRDAGLLEFYRRLIAARRDHPGLWRAERRTVALDDDVGLLAYRSATSEAEATVVFNNGTGLARFRPDGSDTWRLGLATDDGVTYDGGVLTLPALAGSILFRDDRE
jgi:hypothetical protein